MVERLFSTDVFDARLNLRLAIQIHPAKPDAGVRRRRQKGHVDPVAAVQADTRVTDRFPQSLLLEHGEL